MGKVVRIKLSEKELLTEGTKSLDDALSFFMRSETDLGKAITNAIHGLSDLIAASTGIY